MKKISFLQCLIIFSLFFLSIGCSSDEDEQMEVWEIEVAQVTSATSKYANFQTATSEGLIDVSGYVPNMGHHYLNPTLVDGTFEINKPEIILYTPDQNGNMIMVGIEYSIVPASPDNPGAPPEGFDGNLDIWHFNENVGQWQLHVWTMLENPDGIFASFNPAIGD